jgi:hypothetical protein
MQSLLAIGSISLGKPSCHDEILCTPPPGYP